MTITHNDPYVGTRVSTSTRTKLGLGTECAVGPPDSRYRDKLRFVAAVASGDDAK